MSGEIVIIMWRDIPVQVIARDGREVYRVSLPPRFQVAVDRSAMDSGLAGTDQYLDHWRQTEQACEGDLETGAAAAASKLEDSFPLETLNAYVENGGLAPELEEQG